ncbi:MAG: toll/interleukin-1 receptor domain-containing protein, partial [Melioribacteraceae bacterium]
MNSRIFISYAKEDRLLAKRLSDELKINGRNVWFDEESLVGGQKWLIQITEAIKNSKYFIALLSNSAVSKRGIVQKEIKEAIKI